MVAGLRISGDGVADRVEFFDDDYRNVRGEYDAFVSVGMLEHVGRHHYESLSKVLRRIVRRDGGRGLLHFIGRDAPRPLNAWTQRRIFPGAYAPTLSEVATQVLTPAGMSIVDVENLRLCVLGVEPQESGSIEKIQPPASRPCDVKLLSDRPSLCFPYNHPGVRVIAGGQPAIRRKVDAPDMFPRRFDRDMLLQVIRWIGVNAAACHDEPFSVRRNLRRL